TKTSLCNGLQHHPYSILPLKRVNPVRDLKLDLPLFRRGIFLACGTLGGWVPLVSPVQGAVFGPHPTVCLTPIALRFRPSAAHKIFLLNLLKLSNQNE